MNSSKSFNFSKCIKSLIILLFFIILINEKKGNCQNRIIYTKFSSKGLSDEAQQRIKDDFDNKLKTKGYSIVSDESQSIFKIQIITNFHFGYNFEINLININNPSQKISIKESIRRNDIISLLNSNEWEQLSNTVMDKIDRFNRENLSDSLRMCHNRLKNLKINYERLELIINEKESTIRTLEIDLDSFKYENERNVRNNEELTYRLEVLQDSLADIKVKLGESKNIASNYSTRSDSIEKRLSEISKKLKACEAEKQNLENKIISVSKSNPYKTAFITSISWFLIALAIFFIKKKPVQTIGTIKTYGDFKKELVNKINRSISINFREINIDKDDLIFINPIDIVICVNELLNSPTINKIDIDSVTKEKAKKLRMIFNPDNFNNNFKKEKIKNIKLLIKRNKSKLILKKSKFILLLPIKI